MFDLSEIGPILTLAILIPLGLLYVASLIDLFRRTDLSVIRKLAWAALIIVTAFIGVALYYLMRPPREPEGKQSGDTHAHSESVVDQLEDLRLAHDKGEIDDDQYLAAKRRTLGLADTASGS